MTARRLLFLTAGLMLIDARTALPQSAPPEGGTWAVLAPTVRQTSTIYDPVRKRMIVFGGRSDRFYNDVWELSLTGPPLWTQLQPAGEPPPPSQGHTAIYDPIRDRMIVFGGYHDTTECEPRSGCETFMAPNDGVWALSLSGAPEWTQLIGPGAAPPEVWRRFHSAIYDRINDRMIVYGGLHYSDSVLLDDLWSLSMSTLQWTRLDPPAPTPGGRAYHAAIFDPIRGRMVVFGCNGLCSDPREIWSLTLVNQPTWTRIVPSGSSTPVDLQSCAAIYDPMQDCAVIRPFYGSVQLWELSLNGTPRWTPFAPPGPTPAFGGSGIYDAEHGRMIFFGADLGALSLTGNPTWEDFYPLRRDAPAVIYDPGRCRLVMFGGYNGYPLDDIWTLSMGPRPIWTKLNVPPGPAARYLHTAVFDPVRARMIVYGGLGFSDVWALSLEGDPAWMRILPVGNGPSDGRSKAAVYVPGRDQIWVFGSSPDDVWSLDLAGTPVWHSISTVGSAPGPGAVYYEAARNRIIACGNGTYALSLDSAPAWSVIIPPGLDWSRSVYDSARNRVITYHDPMRELNLSDSTWSQVAVAGPPLPGLSYPAIVDAQNDRAFFYGSQDNSLRTLTWATAESLVVGATVSSGGQPIADGASFAATPALSVRIPGVTCLDLALCVVRLDGADLSPPVTAEPSDALELALPALAQGEHQLELRLVSFGARRVIGLGTLSFRIVPAADRLSLEVVRATPNPARGSVRLAFRLGKPADYTIDLYDLTGRRVAHLAGGRGTAGANIFQWNGTMDGHLVGSGFYLYKVTATDGSGIVSKNGRVLFLR